VKTWPQIELPEVSVIFPELKLNCTSGALPATSNDWRMYVCGITPYDATHLGHAATYLTFDLINRYQSYSKSKVSFVENVTDIDDPLLERAARDDQNWENLAKDQISLFAEDMQALRILPPKVLVPVTEAMELIKSAILKLEKKGFTYSLNGDIYFKIEDSLDFLPIPLEAALKIFGERGGDPSRSGKLHPLDPLLWLAHRPGEPKWGFELGAGRPGWHLECSVIALENLFEGRDNSSRSSCVDLQGGGSDLIFPHHFMSAVLANALTGVEFAASYVHTGMVGLNGEKMSKSKGNLVFVSKLLRDGIEPMVIRYALLNSHYSTDRMWTASALTQAAEKVSRLRQVLSRQEIVAAPNFLNNLAQILSNDLNTVSVLEVLDNWAALNLSGEPHGEEYELINPGEISRFLDGVFGLAL
jgi:L-cysteine:1D-myo-inositol 2-amino-2-deoxy-alpha-D-glucopyranoside ligase